MAGDAVAKGWILGTLLMVPPVIVYTISTTIPKEYFTNTCVEIQTAKIVKGLETEIKNFFK